MSSSKVGKLKLGTRTFQVTRASVCRRGNLWEVEVKTECEEYDGERWEPRLYHQGLLVDAFESLGPQGQWTTWISGRDEDYPHPEAGYMYVFGHHDVRSCTGLSEFKLKTQSNSNGPESAMCSGTMNTVKTFHSSARAQPQWM